MNLYNVTGKGVHPDCKKNIAIDIKPILPEENPLRARSTDTNHWNLQKHILINLQNFGNLLYFLIRANL